MVTLRKLAKPGLVVVAAILVGFIAGGERSSYGVFVVPIQDAFRLTRSQAVLPMSLSAILLGAAQPFIGAYIDAKGPRRTVLIAVVVLTLGLLFTANAQNLWQLMLAYGVMVGGSAAGMAGSAWAVLIGGWFTPQRRARALSYISAAMPFSAMVFAPFAQVLISHFDWRGAFLTFALLILFLVIPIAFFFLHEPPAFKEARFVSTPDGVTFFSAGVRQALKSKVYWLLLTSWFGCGIGLTILQAHLPAFGSLHGFSRQEGATALGILGGASSVGVLLGGWTADRWGRYRTLTATYIIRVAALLLLTFFVSNVTSFYIFTFFAGLAIISSATTTQLLVYEIFGSKIAGRMIGFTFFLHQVGGSIGPYFGGKMFEFTGNYTLAFLITAGILVLSVILAWNVGGPAKKYIAAREAASPTLAAIG